MNQFFDPYFHQLKKVGLSVLKNGITLHLLKVQVYNTLASIIIQLHWLAIRYS